MEGETLIGDDEIEFRKLTRSSESDLDQFYALLELAFPTDELETREDFKDALESNADGILALIDERVAGGLVYEHYVHGSVQLLAYLVVSHAIRGRGLGRKLLRMGLKDPHSTLTLAEIEDPRYWPISKQNDPVSRLRFWAREGCKLLPIAYVQPGLRSRSQRVQHLLLIVVPRQHESSVDSVPGHLLASFLREYYLASEGEVSSGDSQFQELLAACSVDRLRLSPLNQVGVADAQPP